MYLLFTDETNLTEQIDQGIKFFAYGGLIMPLDKMSVISDNIQKLRTEYGFKNTDSLKFDSNTRPKNITQSKFAEIKSKVIDLCVENECKFIVYVVLHKIAKKQGIGKTIKWGADHIVGKFNHYLSQKKSHGIVFVDRLSDVGEYNFLSEKFTTGLILKDKTVSLNNIKIFSSTCDNASNLSSVTDVVLGSFRYCINRPLNEEAAKKMIKELIRLLWADKDGEGIDPFEKGLTFRPNPENIKIPSYKEEYEHLIDHINSLLN